MSISNLLVPNNVNLFANSISVLTDVLNLLPIGSSPNNDGVTLFNQDFNLEPADSTHGGVLTSSGTQFIGGVKEFKLEPIFENGIAFKDPILSAGIHLGYNGSPAAFPTYILPVDEPNNTEILHETAIQVPKNKELDDSCALVDSLDNNKQVKWNCSNTASGDKTFLVFDGTGNQNIVFPQTGFTVCSTGLVQVLSNKSFSDAIICALPNDQIVFDGGAFSTTLDVPVPAAMNLRVTIPDAGINSSVILSESNQTINGAKKFGTTLELSSGSGLLSYYSYVSTAASMSGVGAVPLLMNYRISRLGNTVSFNFNAASIAAAAAVKFSSSGGDIPIPLRPAADFISPILILDNSTNVMGEIKIFTTGTFVLSNINQANYTLLGNAGWLDNNVTWIL